MLAHRPSREPYWKDGCATPTNRRLPRASLVALVAERRRRDFGDSSRLRAPAQSPAALRIRSRGFLIRPDANFFPCDRAARRYASVEPSTLPSRLPWSEVSRFDEDEVRDLMRETVNRIYRVLMKVEDRDFVACRDFVRSQTYIWDKPKLHTVMMYYVKRSTLVFGKTRSDGYWEGKARRIAKSSLVVIGGSAW